MHRMRRRILGNNPNIVVYDIISVSERTLFAADPLEIKIRVFAYLQDAFPDLLSQPLAGSKIFALD